MTRPARPRLPACLPAAAAGVVGSLVLMACLLAAAAGVVGSLVLLPGTASAAQAGTTTPLRVSIETLAPATIPRTGTVRLTGRITNQSKQTWTDLNVYLLTSEDPILSRSELSAAAGTDPDTPVGSRRAADGLYERVGALAPGESVSYRLSVPRRDLGISGRPGVYWVGVHVLGAEDGERDSIADGRARTFMPLMPEPGTAAARRARTRVSLVVPVKEPVHRGGAGRLLGLPAWHKDLGTDGRLDRLLRLSSGSRVPITWAVDPAVLDAVRSVADGNPPLDLGPAGDTSAPGSGGAPSQTASPGGGSSDQASNDDGNGSGSEPSSARPTARRWLAEFRRQAPDHTVAALPYGDLDVGSVLARERSTSLRTLYTRARALSRATLSEYGVKRPGDLVAPVGGVLPEAALDRLPSGSAVLLRQSALPDAAGPVVPRSGHAPVVLDDEAAGSGGPRPNSRYAALPVRQRLLSDAALHALSETREEPLVVSMPSYWNPGDAWETSRFFRALDQRWLAPVDLPSVVAAASADERGDDTVVYPDADRVARVPASNLEASRRLVETGGVLSRLLTGEDTVEESVAGAAMLTSSTEARLDPPAARDQAGTADEYARAQLAQVRVEGPQFVMMSGESGPVQVTLVNGLEQTVTVGLDIVTAGTDLRVKQVDPVTLGPGRRTSVPLQVSSNDIGVHAVTLRATDAAGASLGSETRFSVRTSNVSTVIWVVMGVAGGLLFLAIAVRLVRRVRRRKATHGPLLPGDPADLPGQELKA